MDEMDVDQVDLDRRREAAAAVAPRLIGSSVDEAQALVDAHEDVWVRFAGKDQPVTADFGFGRITAVVDDGIVVAAQPG